jgi:hypothetical protein
MANLAYDTNAHEVAGFRRTIIFAAIAREHANLLYQAAQILWLRAL